MKKKKHWMTRLWINTCPLIKIAVCLGLLMFSLFRNRIFDISTDWLRTLVSVLCAVLGIAALIGLLLALLEADQLFWDRRDGKIAQKRRLGKKKLLAVEEILALARENDLIEIQADTPGGVVKLGSASDCKPRSFHFFHKGYYIGKAEYERIEDFEAALRELAPGGYVQVMAIDDVPVD